MKSEYGPHRNRHYWLVPESYPFIAVALVLAAIGWWVHPSLLVVFLLLTAFVVFFFRNPKRETPNNQNIVIAPADGKIIDVVEVEEKRFFEGAGEKGEYLYVAPECACE